MERREGEEVEVERENLKRSGDNFPDKLGAVREAFNNNAF